MNQVLLDELIVPQLAKKIPAIYRIVRSITTFTRARCLWILSWAIWISTPSHDILRSISVYFIDANCFITAFVPTVVREMFAYYIIVERFVLFLCYLFICSCMLLTPCDWAGCNGNTRLYSPEVPGWNFKYVILSAILADIVLISYVSPGELQDSTLKYACFLLYIPLMSLFPSHSSLHFMSEAHC
jgi:hypothetical protein